MASALIQLTRIDENLKGGRDVSTYTTVVDSPDFYSGISSSDYINFHWTADRPRVSTILGYEVLQSTVLA